MKILRIVFLVLMMLIIHESIEAQRSRVRRTQRVEEEKPPSTTWYGASLGNLVFFGGTFSFSGKFSYAYEFERRISIGVSGKFFYDSINRFQGPNDKFFTYSGSVFSRLRITDEIFAQGEYGLWRFNDNTGDQTRLAPSVGGGYRTGFEDKSYGFHIMVPLDDRVQNRVNLEYWVDFNWKF